MNGAVQKSVNLTFWTAHALQRVVWGLVEWMGLMGLMTTGETDGAGGIDEIDETVNS